MKKRNPVVTLLFIWVLSTLILGLSACGQSGPLYFPDDIPKSQRAKN